MRFARKYYEKYLNIPIPARAALWFVICSLMQKCISFVTVPIFTRLMPVDDYGIYSTYLSVFNIMVVICTLSLEKCVYINGIAKADNQKEKDMLAVQCLSLAAIVTSIVFLIYLIFRVYFNHLLGLTTPLMCLMFIQIMFDPAITYWTAKQRFEYKYLALVFVTVGMIVTNTGLGMVFVILNKNNKSLARVIAIVLAQVIFGVAITISFWLKAKKVFSVKDWKHFLTVQLPLLPHSLSLTILASSDRIMINSMVGAAATAIYSVAYSSGYVIGTLKNSIVNAMTPWIYSKIKKRDFDAIKELTKPVMLFTMILTFTFIAFAPEIVMIMAPSEYYEAVYVIPPVAASSFFTFLYNMFSQISFYYEETKKIMVASISGAVANLILNAIFIPIFGYIAAGYTTLVCYIAFTFAHYLIMKKIAKKNFGEVSIFDMKYIMILSSVVIIMTVVFAVIYKYTIIRYSVLAILLLVLYVKRSIVIDTLKIMKKTRGKKERQ